ncbi:sigma factor [Streptomyces sp. NBRC 109706]|uniref:sigma factor n=1 Tax=Streptomyces sp. NBRC 109706 TaxID=1550035 RepID=UPI000781A7A1|nr:sigma factor [Streptomyces sp. NBRC 109706]
MEPTKHALVRAGDPEAFRELFRAHARLIDGYALRATGDPTLAEDVVSLTFLEAWRLREQVRDEGPSLRPWLMGTALNTLRNSSRSRRRYQHALARLPSARAAPDIADEVVGRITDAGRVAAARRALAFSDLLPPGIEDGVYEALGRVPGIEVLEDTEDAAGRAAVGLARTDAEAGTRSAYLLDPETFRYLGFQQIQATEHNDIPAGTLLDEYALLELGVVDEQKQRPGQGNGAA